MTQLCSLTNGASTRKMPYAKPGHFTALSTVGKKLLIPLSGRKRPWSQKSSPSTICAPLPSIALSGHLLCPLPVLTNALLLHTKLLSGWPMHAGMCMLYNTIWADSWKLPPPREPHLGHQAPASLLSSWCSIYYRPYEVFIPTLLLDCIPGRPQASRQQTSFNSA